MMMYDRFVLRDEEGEILVEKMMAEHIKVFLDEMKPEDGFHYTVESEFSGYSMDVTAETTSGQWREYSEKCLMALD